MVIYAAMVAVRGRVRMRMRLGMFAGDASAVRCSCGTSKSPSHVVWSC
jgi:hypothetical protein